MTEPFGVVAGAINVAGAFTTCVDVFGYVQAGRHFARDYQTGHLMLNLLGLRLSRWGRAVDVYNDPQLGNASATTSETQAAKDTIMQILVLFEASKKTSKKYKHKGSATSGIASGLPLGAGLGEPEGLAVLALSNKMRALAIERQKGTSLVKLVSWIIKDKPELDQLISSISGLLSQLEALFPAPREAQEQLAREEVANIDGNNEEIQALNSASGGVDPVLHDAAKTSGAAIGHRYKDIEIEGGVDTLVMEGDIIAADYPHKAIDSRLKAAHSYHGITTKGTGRLRVLKGDKYGGKDFFEQ
jgi:hypothetical protein